MVSTLSNATALTEKNVVFVTLDSCRYDVAEEANVPFLRSIGKIRKGLTHGSFTVPAHHSFFAGHLPAVLDEPLAEYYSECILQLWRIKTGRVLEHLRAGLIFEGKNILEGYRHLGFKVMGAGGVSQFSDGSALREYFGKDFIYFGPNLDEEPLARRAKKSFPLNNVERLVRSVDDYDRWFLFINSPETHYPYDIGDETSVEQAELYGLLKDNLNLRNGRGLPEGAGPKLRAMQRTALEYIDGNLKHLFDALPRRRDILVVICGDHGENFGEVFAGKPRWGHLFPSKQVMEVPMVIGQLQAGK